MTAICYFNGEFIPIEQLVVPIDERGHQFGDGVYEVIRVYNRKFFMLEAHMNRLFASAEAIRLQMDYSIVEMQQIIQDAFEKSDLIDCDVYIQITRGIATRKHLFPEAPVSISMTIRPMKVIEDHIRQKGMTAIFHEDERWKNCYIKSLNLLPNILAKQKAEDAGCYEAILIKENFVTEGTSSNVYMVKDRVIYSTPLSKHILAGITRMAVIKLASNYGIPFVEKQFTPEELLQADEVFITSTTNEIMPIVSIDGQKINGGTGGKITLDLNGKFMELTKSVQYA